MLLVDIGLTFGCSVGVMGQILTSSSIIAVIFALLMGLLSVRFKHKSLLITGLSFYAASALGCILAPNYASMLLSYSMSGIGIAMVNPMSIALVGEHIPLEERPSAISWIFACMALSSSFVAGPVITYLSGLGGWRTAFLGYPLLIALASLIIAYVGISSLPQNPESAVRGGDYLEGFKELFSNRSAIACLIGAMLSAAAFQSIVAYGISFYREKFLIPKELTALLWSGMPLGFSVGNLFGGKFVNKFGRKQLTVLGLILFGFFIMFYTNIPGFWLSITLAYLCCLFAGIRAPAASSLTLEQIPRFRGTMMSTNSAAASLGSALGSGVGGMVLLWYGWEVLGMALGGIGIAAALIYYLFTIDPTRT